MFNRHGLSRRGATRAAGDVIGTALVTALLLKLALLVAVAALVVVLVVLVVRVVQRRAALRRPVTPAVPVRRVDDAAARAHRARMAQIRAGR